MQQPQAPSAQPNTAMNPLPKHAAHGTGLTRARPDCSGQRAWLQSLHRMLAVHAAKSSGIGIAATCAHRPPGLPAWPTPSWSQKQASRMSAKGAPLRQSANFSERPQAGHDPQAGDRASSPWRRGQAARLLALTAPQRARPEHAFAQMGQARRRVALPTSFERGSGLRARSGPPRHPRLGTGRCGPRARDAPPRPCGATRTPGPHTTLPLPTLYRKSG